MSGFTSSLTQLAWDKRLCCGGANCLIVSETMKRKGWICRRSKTDKDQELIPCFWHIGDTKEKHEMPESRNTFDCCCSDI
jgi:hypothetical protein